MKRANLTWLFLAALILSLTAFGASAETVASGLDLWTTQGNGQTFVDFASNPLPAGFFCPGSEAFSGQIVFRGVPIPTRPRGALGKADTIIHRLDDAVFVPGRAATRTTIREVDGRITEMGFRGQLVASTRIQVRALRFAGVNPIVTNCGTFRVTAGLHGEQPVTTMLMIRDDEQGGRFFSPLSLVTKLTFTPEDGGLAVELVKQINFPARPDAVWSFRPEANRPRVEGFVRVDTDGDNRVDTFLPGTSNFAAGFKANGGVTVGDDHASANRDYVPYCDGVGTWYAEHCHGTTPVFEQANPTQPHTFEP
ncbi:MAG: hypothetical protein AAF604_07880 [Acidobacteriota bacterium]